MPFISPEHSEQLKIAAKVLNEEIAGQRRIIKRLETWFDEEHKSYTRFVELVRDTYGLGPAQLWHVSRCFKCDGPQKQSLSRDPVRCENFPESEYERIEDFEE